MSDTDDEAVDVGEAAAEAASNAQAVEGGDSIVTAQDMGRPEAGPSGGLFSTDPDPPLGSMPDIWNPEKGGRYRILRGFGKLAGKDLGDGLPAVADIGIGVAEEASKDPASVPILGGFFRPGEAEAEAEPEAEESDAGRGMRRPGGEPGGEP